MSTTHRTIRSATARRVATGLALATVVASGAALGGCSDDGGNKAKATTTTVDRAAVALDVQCELIKSYMNFESTRSVPPDASASTTPAIGVDPATRAQFETRRSQALTRLVDSFKGTVPTEIADPLTQLKTFVLTADPQPYAEVQAALVKVTGYFDPKCGTVGGRDKETSTTTNDTTATSAATSSTTK